VRTGTDEELIATSITAAVGLKPIILCGSRATGDATDGSDYDVFVVLPTLETPFALRRFAKVSNALENQLGAEVSVNPLPRFRLRHSGPSLLVWKIRREGKLLAAPASFTLGPAEEPITSQGASSSYAFSGIRFLIKRLDPPELASAPLRQELHHAVGKALLHLAQLELLRKGVYASRLEEALALLNDTGQGHLAELARSSKKPQTWFRARDLLLRHVRVEPPVRRRAFLSNAQYVALSMARGTGLHFRAIACRTAVRTDLERLVILLVTSVRPDGTVYQPTLSAAARSMPRWLHAGRDSTWTALRDAVELHWPQANPLLGL
jgi:predicted nucleotidyltransferase